MNKLYISWSGVLKYGTILSIIVTALVILGFLIEPLIFATDLPEEVQKQIGEIPNSAMYLSLGVFLSIVFSCIFLSYKMIMEAFKERLSQASYLNFLINSFLLLNFMSLWDVIIIDILIFDTIQPGFMTIKGLESIVREKTTAAFHFIGFIKGIPYLLIFAAIAAGITLLLSKKARRQRAINS